MIGFAKGVASKRCTENATWFAHPASNSTKPWTNYTDCIDHKDYHVSISQENNVNVISRSIIQIFYYMLL